jgi:CBS domain-containing protein
MRIRDIMSKDVQVARPGDTLQEVARRMASGDFGFIPVADGDQLVGTLTDRDIAVRAVAAGVQPTAPIAEYVSREPWTVREDDDLQEALSLMGERQVRRAPVVDKHGKLVGVVSLGDLASRVKEKHAGETLEDISESR